MKRPFTGYASFSALARAYAGVFCTAYVEWISSEAMLPSLGEGCRIRSRHHFHLVRRQLLDSRGRQCKLYPPSASLAAGGFHERHRADTF